MTTNTVINLRINNEDTEEMNSYWFQDQLPMVKKLGIKKQMTDQHLMEEQQGLKRKIQMLSWIYIYKMYNLVGNGFNGDALWK